jgi:uncharacterized integral membrane protein
MKDLKTLFTIVLICLVVLFAVQNAAVVEIQFLLWSFAMPRALMVALLLSIGIIIGILIAGHLRKKH